MIHHKPLRSTWSQLSAVSVCILLFHLREEKANLWKSCMNVAFFFSTDDPVILRKKKKKTLPIAKCFWKLPTSKDVEFDTSGQEKRV